MNKNEKINLVPKLRFREFKANDNVVFKKGDLLFKAINNKNHNSDLPVLAITQEHGAIPRKQIGYNVSVSSNSIKNYKVVEIGDFIISLRSFQGGIEYSSFYGICSTAYIVLRKKNDIVEQYYKYYFKTSKFINDLTKDLEGIRDGKIISYRQFSSLLLPMPNNKEQQKIADCLSSLDELIFANEKKLAALKLHKKALMQKLFPTEEETIPEWRFPEFRSSGKWVLKAIREVCDSYSGGTPATSNKANYGGKIPFIRSGEISKKVTELFLTEEGLKNSSAKMVAIGDVLVALYGANSGEVALSKINGAINQAILCLKHKSKNALIYHYLSHNKQRILKTHIQGGQGNLSGEIIKSVKLNFPSSFIEQQKISACLTSIDKLIEAQIEKIEKLKLHKKGLMQGLFPSFEEIEE